MLRVGFTGGIGSGKSTVSRQLAGLGATVIDADVLAREVVAPGTPGLTAVLAEFGPAVRAADGSLDRAALGALVFADDERRAALNAIVHPLVYARRSELVAQVPDDAVVVEDVPLLVENRLASGFHLVVVVHAPEGERLRRVLARGGSARLDDDQVRARMRAQAGDDERRAAADVWLDNSGPQADTAAAVDELWAHRLRPFEENLRTRQQAPRHPSAVIADADPSWPEQARRVIARVVATLGERALRVEHTGSTSVPGLPAKDVIDLQVVLADLDAAAAAADALTAAGLVRMPGRWWDVGRDGVEWDKAMACNADPGRPVNCHLRPVSSPTARDAVLFRDWLRASPGGVDEYAALKRRLAAAPHDSIDAYAEAKTPFVNASLAQAEIWAERTGWSFD